MSSPQSGAVAHALEAVLRQDGGRLTAVLIARLGDFQLAEDALQEASVSALAHWGRSGIPASPAAWLLRVAFRKAIDRLRGSAREDRKAADVASLAREEAEAPDPEHIADERLRLIFTCCHPALDPKSRVALTLRTLGGMTTGEIARAFLDTETTMGQRLSRAKAKIAAAGIPFKIPEPDAWGERLGSVLTVVYLIFNAGYTAGVRPERDLCDEAVSLARLLNALTPGEAEVEGCLALLLLTHARRAARTSPDGVTVVLDQQDRGRWDAAMIDEGLATLDVAVARRAPGPFQLKAAIDACQVQGDVPDWPQIAALYAGLLAYEPTPVVRLNLAVARAEAGEAQVARAELDALADALDDYPAYHAARAALLSRWGERAAALTAYDRAIALAASPSDAAFLTRQRDGLRATMAR